MIAIIDYGMGNLRSVQKALEHVGAEARIVDKPAELDAADKVVLPGVGAFRDAVEHLRTDGFVEPLINVIGSGRPFLGICLGLQLLFDISHEDGEQIGLGVFGGHVRRFSFDETTGDTRLKVPHMGWNQLRWSQSCPLLAGLEPGAYFYFVHSYYVDPDKWVDPEKRVDPDEKALARATCDYGIEFTAMVWRENVYATQFHPEKSQQNGLRLLENFAAL